MGNNRNRFTWMILPGLIASIIACISSIIIILYQFKYRSYIIGNPEIYEDTIGSLISAYSIFITIVLFVIGIPFSLIGIFSYRKNTQTKELLDKVNFMQNQIDENEKYADVNKQYDSDPQNLRTDPGKSQLQEFFKYKMKKQEDDAKKLFYEGIYLMPDKIRDINDIKKNSETTKNGHAKYEVNVIKDIMTAVGYFTMCEQLVPVNNGSKSITNFKTFTLYDIYREKYNACKELGVYFSESNKVIAMEYLITAIEYCQKAILSENSYILPFNNKSNILKDIYRLFHVTDDLQNDNLIWMARILKDKVKFINLAIFDFKRIVKFANEIYSNVEEDEFVKAIAEIVDPCEKSDLCSKCDWNCTNYFKTIEEIDIEKLFLLMLLESISCIKNKLEEDKILEMKKDSDDYKNIQPSYYNCAISEFLLIEFRDKVQKINPLSDENSQLYSNFKTNVIESMKKSKEMEGSLKIFKNKFYKDIDLRTLLKAESGDYFTIRLELEEEIKKLE
jgi:hypothetical protein